MAVTKVAKRGGVWGVWSFIDGFVPSPLSRQATIEEEIRRGGDRAVEAIVNRLMRQGQWELAEEIMDTRL
jgi:hypothetical protein